MKLKGLDLLLPRFGFVFARDVFGIAEQAILYGQSDREKQNAARVKRPTSVVLKDLFYRYRQKCENRKQADVPYSGDPRGLVTADQTAIINGIVRDRRDNDDQHQDKEMR